MDEKRGTFLVFGHLEVPIRVNLWPSYSKTGPLFHHAQSTTNFTCVQFDAATTTALIMLVLFRATRFCLEKPFSCFNVLLNIYEC